MNNTILLYSLANTFKSSFGINVCSNTTAFLDSDVKSEFKKLTEADQSHYVTYSLKLANSLREYIPRIIKFYYNPVAVADSVADADSDADADAVADADADKPESQIQHDFRLESKKYGTRLISMTFANLESNDIIPCKLMKICNYRKNTNMYKEYMPLYKDICTNAYNMISDSERYSELSTKTKQKYLYNPIIDLTISTLSKKRKCAEHLYKHLFNEPDRIMLKIHKRKFIIYDFGIELAESDIKSYRIGKLDVDDSIFILFNNGVQFNLLLRTNNGNITEYISLKYHTKMHNMDQLYAIKRESVIPK